MFIVIVLLAVVVVVVVVVVVAITYQTPLHSVQCVPWFWLRTTGPDMVDMPSGVPSRTEVIPTATFLWILWPGPSLCPWMISTRLAVKCWATGKKSGWDPPHWKSWLKSGTWALSFEKEESFAGFNDGVQVYFQSEMWIGHIRDLRGAFVKWNSSLDVPICSCINEYMGEHGKKERHPLFVVLLPFFVFQLRKVT